MKKLIAAITALMILLCGCTAVFAEQTTLTREDAMKIALDRVGVQENQVRFTKVKLDWDDGRQVYEIEFVYNGTEYEFDIDARSGRILESDRDYADRYDRYDRDDDWDWDDWFDFD